LSRSRQRASMRPLLFRRPGFLILWVVASCSTPSPLAPVPSAPASGRNQRENKRTSQASSCRTANTPGEEARRELYLRISTPYFLRLRVTAKALPSSCSGCESQLCVPLCGNDCRIPHRQRGVLRLTSLTPTLHGRQLYTVRLLGGLAGLGLIWVPIIPTYWPIGVLIR
jgi:hypothetical protein